MEQLAQLRALDPVGVKLLGKLFDSQPGCLLLQLQFHDARPARIEGALKFNPLSSAVRSCGRRKVLSSWRARFRASSRAARSSTASCSPAWATEASSSKSSPCSPSSSA